MSSTLLLSPPRSILLLPTKQSSNSLSSAASSASSHSSSSASSSSSSVTTSTSTQGPGRKIRFAPLPDPRRAVLLTPEGNEIPLPDGDSPELPASAYAHPLRSPLPRPPPSPATPTTPLPSSPPSSYSRSSGTWPRPKGLLRTFRKGNTPASSTDSLTPTPSVETGPDPNLEASLQRWSSGNSTLNGSPLARTQSQTSTSSKRPGRSRSIFRMGGGDKAKSRTSSVPPALNPFANSLGSTPKRATRMLNGRVYGSRNGDGRNPFANVRDTEPDFVEWGYGGMGSVKHGVGSSAWNKVQAGGAKTNSADGDDDGHVGMGVVGHGDDDDDDGSGMGWVRRRREAREREAREREERERAEKEAQVVNAEGDGGGGEDDDEDSASANLPTPTATEPPTSFSSSNTPLATPAIPFTSSPLVGGTPTQEEEHVLRAVNVPAGFRGHNHSHSHGHHRSSSNTLAALNVPGVHITPPDDSPADAPPSSASESGSESDEEDDDDEPNANQGNEDYDEDEEETDDEQQRVTALGAGVEKISRHKE
uniref:Uncharacterized protein n=1 Tax=Mycena chlorophos TaxID=658473 RepID=A0ABQ0M836_MYCCL|nr:predicted protein [Mycena chlorophos]